MVSEMEKIAAEFQDRENKSSPYAKLLLSNLNITDKYVQLENKYNQLLQEHERMMVLYREPGKFQWHLQTGTRKERAASRNTTATKKRRERRPAPLPRKKKRHRTQ